MCKLSVRSIAVAAALTLLLAPGALAADEWQSGLGTGVFGLNISGDAGVGTNLGPVAVDLDLDTSDVADLLDSAVGLGGYSTKGKWTLMYSAGQLKLEGDNSGTGLLGNPVAADLSFTATGAVFEASYRFALTGKHAWGVLGGVRYTKHEIDFGLAIDNDPPNPPATLTRNVDNDWTDVVVGLTHGTRINDKWTWGNQLDAGFGGSEGTYFFKSSFGWQFAKSWALGFYGQITSVEYENGNPGDLDWYLYDADEYGVGFNILYTF